VAGRSAVPETFALRLFALIFGHGVDSIEMAPCHREAGYPGCATGTSITIAATGKEAAPAVEALSALVASRFGEEE